MSTPKLLVIDDEKNILNALKRLLRSESFETFATDSPEEAFERIAREPYAVVVSDHKMPAMLGTDFLEKVREISPDTIRIMLTGYADIQAAMDAINRGAVYRFLTKPWKDEELRLVLREAVSRYELVAENKRLHELTERQNAELKDFNRNLEAKVAQRTEEVQRLNQELHKSLMGSIQLLAELAEIHSPVVGSHSKRVAALCGQLGKQLNLPERDLLDLVIAATLHDIGKIAVPSEVLAKPERQLKRSDRDVIRRHAVQGEAIAGMVPNLGEVPGIIRHHHERFDGRGYPDGLRGEAIPLVSRIIAVGDAYDNHLNRRATFESATREKTMEFIQEGSGAWFDPEVVVALRACLAAGAGTLSEEAEVDIHTRDLQEGMVLSRDLHTVRGVLLLPKGTLIQAESIASIRKYEQTDPVVDGIYVYRKRPAVSST